MFSGIASGIGLIIKSIKVFNRYPKFIIPLIIIWLVYAPIILFLNFWPGTDSWGLGLTLFVVLVVIFIFAFILSLACSVLLELIRQLESGQEMSVTKAFINEIKFDLGKIFPIVVVWTLIWLILLFLQALFSKKKSRDRESFSAESAARTLNGFNDISLSSGIFDSLEKGIRMIVFLILPAIVWENLPFLKAVKKGVAIFKSNLSVFVTGYILTSAVTTIIFLPPALVFLAKEELGVVIPTWGWILVIIYGAFAWSYSIYLEQMFNAELYLWNLKWEKEVEKAHLANMPIPNLMDVAKPSVLDDMPDLVDYRGY